MKHETHSRKEAARFEYGSDSRDRMAGLLSITDFGPPADFDPDEISWVLPKLAVTDWEGGIESMLQGHFVICVAGELPNQGHVHMPVEPGCGPEATVDMLNRISEVIHWLDVATDKKVVVHCAMGMERSVLAVVWYLHRYQNMTLDEAYQMVGVVRPIAADRRCWI